MQGRLERYRLFWRIRRARDGVVLAGLLAVLLMSGPLAERWGDRFQIALPLLGLGCTVLTGGTGEYLARFAVMELAVHGTKQGLGAVPINQRPGGGLQGFPSGHTAAATFGASALLHECIRSSLPVQAAVVIAAGFTGASRIEAERHTIWQVLAGVLVGWLTERAFRAGGRQALRRLSGWAARCWPGALPGRWIAARLAAGFAGFTAGKQRRREI